MTLDPPHRDPGAGSVLLTYVLLLVGFFAIGFSTQARWPIPGLWITEALAIALPAFAYLRGANIDPRAWLGLHPPSSAAVGFTLLVALLNQPAIALLEWGAQKLSPPNWILTFQQKNVFLEQIFAQNATGMILAVTIAAPLGEELFFRGLAQPALQKRLGFWPGLILTSVMFALIHLDPVGFVGLFELGIFFGLVRHATGSLWASMVAHAANNGIAAAAFMLGMNRPEEVPPTWLLVLGAVLLAALIGAASTLAKRRSPAPARALPWNPEQQAGRFSFQRALVPALIWGASVACGAVLVVTSLLRQLQHLE